MANVTCEKMTQIRVVGYPVLSTFMFIAGVGGNVLALVILGVHRKELRSKSSVFCILVTGLAITDLLGTCFLSPLVFVSYAYNASIVGLVGNHSLCDFFGFTMTFFALASMLILCAMAVERCMAISHPYFYSKHNSKGLAKAALAAIYVLSCFFCCLPFFAFGEHKQYCPGTWCFIKMDSTDRKVIAFSLCYATLMAFLILIILICNGSVIVSLCNMYKNQRSRRGSVISNRTRKSWIGQGDEEVDHLILLASMTTIFVICFLPLTLASMPSRDTPAHCIQREQPWTVPYLPLDARWLPPWAGVMPQFHTGLPGNWSWGQPCWVPKVPPGFAVFGTPEPVWATDSSHLEVPPDLADQTPGALPGDL